jgi:hypothetical protein
MTFLLSIVSGWMRRAFFQSAVAMTVIGGGAGEVINIIDVSDVPPVPVVVDLTDVLPSTGSYPSRTSTPTTLVIHHTASGTTQDWGTIAEFHVRVNKWKAIGYAFGTSWDGKRFLLNDPTKRQNQTRNNNSTTIGLVMLGNFHTGPLNETHLLVTKAYARELCELYGYRYIRPHRDFVNSACPGKFAMEQLDDLWIRP